VVYIGASVSLLVAIVAAIAVVLSMPVREHLVDTPSSAIDSVKPSNDKKKDEKKKDEKKDDKKKDDKKDDKKKDEPKKDEKKDDPTPAGDAAVITDKKDHFTLQNAAPF
jgi:hypothetical protein